MFVNGDEKNGAKLLQRKAREETKYRLLADIIFDLEVCKLEGYNFKEYITELKNEIDNIYNSFMKKESKDEN